MKPGDCVWAGGLRAGGSEGSNDAGFYLGLNLDTKNNILKHRVIPKPSYQAACRLSWPISVYFPQDEHNLFEAVNGGDGLTVWALSGERPSSCQLSQRPIIICFDGAVSSLPQVAPFPCSHRERP